MRPLKESRAHSAFDLIGMCSSVPWVLPGPARARMVLSIEQRQFEALLIERRVINQHEKLIPLLGINIIGRPTMRNRLALTLAFRSADTTMGNIKALDFVLCLFSI